MTNLNKNNSNLNSKQYLQIHQNDSTKMDKNAKLKFSFKTIEK